MTREELVAYLRGEFLRGPAGHRAEQLADFIGSDEQAKGELYAEWKAARIAAIEAEAAAIAAYANEIP